MGIIKSLLNVVGKTFVFVSETPIPEYAGLISAILDVAAVAVSYNVDPYKEVVEDAGDDCSYIRKEMKTNPVDVMERFCIFSDNFSIREGVKEYKTLDQEGKELVTVVAISLGMKSLYFIGATVRFCRAAGKCVKYMDMYEKEKAAHNYSLDYVKFMDHKLSNVIDTMSPHMNEFSEGDRQEYNNYMNISADLRAIVDVAANNRKAVAA